jgi:hypothetical protein
LSGSGIIEGGQIIAPSISGGAITGPLIQTSAAGYPRIQMSSIDNLLTAYADADNILEINPKFQTADLNFKSFGYSTSLFQSTDNFDIISATQISVRGNSGVVIDSSGGDIDLFASASGKFTTVDNWGKFRNRQTLQTLQQSLDAKAQISHTHSQSDVDGLVTALSNKIGAGTGGTRKVDYINASDIGLVVWFTNGTNATLLFD